MSQYMRYSLYDEDTFRFDDRRTSKPKTLFRILGDLSGKVLIFVSLVRELTYLIPAYVTDHLGVRQKDTSFAEISGLLSNHRFAYYHGQMGDLEKTFNMDLIRSGNADRIFCTSSLLTGIDIPNVNNLVVYESVLYTPEKKVINIFEYIKLEGRVGRSGGESSIHVFNFTNDRTLADYGKNTFWEDFDRRCVGLLPAAT
jgi:superfamily II DNA/RNA helicase